MGEPEILDAPNPISDSISEAYQRLRAQDYPKAIALYEAAIERDPQPRAPYWYLGLALLLAEQEAEAQTTWLFALSEGDEAQQAAWSLEIATVLGTEADLRADRQEWAIAWALRKHLQAICPSLLNNALHLVRLAAQQAALSAEDLTELIAALPTAQEIDLNLLFDALDVVLRHLPPDESVYFFTEACLPQIQPENYPAFMARVLPRAMRIGHGLGSPTLAADLLGLYLRLDPDNLEVIGHLATFYQNSRQYDLGIQTAQRRLDLGGALIEQVFSSHLLLRGLLSGGGYWSQAVVALNQHEVLLKRFAATATDDLNPLQVVRLCTACYYIPYFRDTLRSNQGLRNQIMALCTNHVRRYAQPQVARFEDSHARRSRLSRAPGQKLKIGYISHCMGRHSVGWLARWLIQHHDREQVELYGYFINDRQEDDMYQWFMGQMDHVCQMKLDMSLDTYGLAEQIHADGVDILVDLDSLTLDLTCEIMALKPAPVQVTWLGWDASGIPTIDYFIADPYVLPEWADEFYNEKIWRLPQAYLGVDGFEVGTPTLRRADLEIPEDAVIFFSGQKGYKRHYETAKLQMQIIAQVPGSYFLIKGGGDQQAVQDYFTAIARDVGADPERLRFLPNAPTELIHRANLAIADVVLDTFPYNGATTTMEVLWMGIPLVTWVGESFSSRNSYTMLVNAGVEAGIAWSAEEYVAWGVKLGRDGELRQQVRDQLWRSRRTSPLWDGKGFARQMEAAYQQMWQIFCGAADPNSAQFTLPT
jgi:predicted O-linked N-acetylglucosamine transferase (SPINDLY family)